MVTHTSIKDFLDMKMTRFYMTFAAICRVLDKRNQ